MNECNLWSGHRCLNTRCRLKCHGRHDWFPHRWEMELWYAFYTQIVIATRHVWFTCAPLQRPPTAQTACNHRFALLIANTGLQDWLVAPYQFIANLWRPAWITDNRDLAIRQHLVPTYKGTPSCILLSRIEPFAELTCPAHIKDVLAWQIGNLALWINRPTHFAIKLTACLGGHTIAEQCSFMLKTRRDECPDLWPFFQWEMEPTNKIGKMTRRLYAES